MNGVDSLLQAVAMYRSKDPKTSDEEEMLENLFVCLCCVLMPMENKEGFVKAEGVELMIIIMMQKRLPYSSAIRTLDFAMTRFPPACERFVDVLDLKTAFAALMGKASDRFSFHLFSLLIFRNIFGIDLYCAAVLCKTTKFVTIRAIRPITVFIAIAELEMDGNDCKFLYKMNCHFNC